MSKKKKNTNNYLKYVLKVFFVTFFSILLIGGIVLLSVYLVKKMPENQTKETVETIKPIEIFPGPIKKEEIVVEKELEGKYGELLADLERMKAENTYAKEAKTKEEVELLFAGDILFDPNYAVMANLLRKGGEIESGFSNDLLDRMRNADIFMLNNEFPYSAQGTPLAEKMFTFRAKPESVNYLTQMGVDIISLANNHAYDYGETALLDTLSIVREENILYAGAGKNIEEAAAPLYLIINDQKIAFICATQIERLDNPDTKEATETAPGVFRCWNPQRLYEVIADAEKNSDFVVVYVHWGTENVTEIDWAQREHAPKYVEAGADLIIGDHSHCLQPIEFIGDVPIIYSVGNFWFNSKTIDTAMIEVTLSKEGILQYEFIPCKQEQSQTRLLEGEERQRVIDQMNALSKTAFINSDGMVEKK